ncbi:MAG: S9 family peptidase [Phycisphaerales bacterium]|nr:S9 family peptidase [Phycisphaerae bacterium]NNF42543.1 S9 family peptidase [Phycisphaerales bacterium]NNM27466.1 S9 family peptidase [Phycisphaerales bacterium]
MPTLAPMLALASTGAVAAATLAQPIVRDHDITLDDYFTQVYVAEIAASPDGTRVAYVEGRWDETLDRRNMDLWVVSVADDTVRRLTFDTAADTKPRWSPDGRFVYFLSTRERAGETAPPWNGERQVWRASVTGDAITAVTRREGGVHDFELAANGRTLYYTTGEESTETDPWQSLRDEFDDIEYGHGVVEYSQLWKLDLQSWRTEKLVDESRVIRAFCVAPDERRIAMITTPTAELITNEGWSHVDVLEMPTRSIVRLDDTLFRDRAPSPYGWIVTPAFSSDGRKLAFRVDFDGYPGELFVAHFDGDTPAVTKLIRPGEVTADGTLAWQPGTHDLCFLADDHARQRLVAITNVQPGGQGAAVTITPGDVVLNAFDFAANGSRLAVLESGRTHTADIFVAEPPFAGRARRRVTNLNPQIDTWKIPRIELLEWTSPDGTPVEGILELPPDYTPGPPLPLLVTIHGGPTASSKLAFRYWMYGRTIYAAQGWAVLDPNYRGSTGYGDRFLTDLIGNKNNLDVQDIIAGIDTLIARGIADPERIAVTGWSNGGYLTNCLIAADQRFKAASSGAGVFDTVMQWSIEDTPGHVINYSGGLPWERSQKMHETSPLYDVDKVVTPTLVHVGENDARVPVEHSRALHRALHHYLDVPCELLVYPGEGHGLTKLSHRKAKMKWDHEWFGRYVLGESGE